MSENVAHTRIGGEEKCMHSFGGNTRKERDHLQELDIDWRIILK
jgi:hypothetical protein